jgi:hypothetical protein
VKCGKDAREASGADWGLFASPAGEVKAKQRSAKSPSSPLQMQPVKWYKKPGPPQLLIREANGFPPVQRWPKS